MSAHAMPFGAEALEQGVRFRYWAPSQADVTLELIGQDGGLSSAWPMERSAAGWHERVSQEAAVGTRYRFRLADGTTAPDPASRFNPLGVHGPSEVVDPRAHAWRDAEWRGLPWPGAVLYQLHVGTFTPEGTFAAAGKYLADLKALGITGLQLMPLAQFGGDRGWGYDGVLPFAPHVAYGPPETLKGFVDAAHENGLMVLFDVVYNHFGPEGNYLWRSCPEFFNAEHRTPWGPAINFDAAGSEVVRRFFIDNALYWVNEYHADGLRIDAVHAICDTSPRHIVVDIAEALREGPGRDRDVHLVLENHANQASLLVRDADNRPLVARAQWNDDLHHAAHVVATRERHGYYADYVGEPTALLGRALAEGFVYQGQASSVAGGSPRGEPSGGLPSQAFVAFLQNHDQVGNRAFGERLDALADRDRVEALLACLLLAPAVPMLFMGEEFATESPFLYFCDFHDELARSVTEGRRSEFEHAPGPTALRQIPDPNAFTTFQASLLRWEERASPRAGRRLALVRELLALRSRHLVPRLHSQRTGGGAECVGEAFSVDWCFGDGSGWTLRANFGWSPVTFPNHAGEMTIFGSNFDGSNAALTHLGPNGVVVGTWPQVAA